MTSGAASLNPMQKLALAGRIWRSYLSVQMGLRQRPLPVLIGRLGVQTDGASYALQPRRASRIVDRVLHIGPFRPRCLVGALVLFRLLRGQGVSAQLVIGLPEVPKTKEAHAWVEIEGRDVGPAPGRAGHTEVARYG
jgi:hypothetical protein